MKKLLGIALASAAAGLCLSALKKASDEQTVELSPVKRSSPEQKSHSGGQLRHQLRTDSGENHRRH